MPLMERCEPRRRVVHRQVVFAARSADQLHGALAQAQARYPSAGGVLPGPTLAPENRWGHIRRATSTRRQERDFEETSWRRRGSTATFTPRWAEPAPRSCPTSTITG